MLYSLCCRSSVNTASPAWVSPPCTNTSLHRLLHQFTVRHLVLLSFSRQVHSHAFLNKSAWSVKLGLMLSGILRRLIIKTHPHFFRIQVQKCIFQQLGTAVLNQINDLYELEISEHWNKNESVQLSPLYRPSNHFSGQICTVFFFTLFGLLVTTSATLLSPSTMFCFCPCPFIWLFVGWFVSRITQKLLDQFPPKGRVSAQDRSH